MATTAACRKQGPFQALKGRSGPTERIAQGDSHADKARGFTGKRRPGREQEAEGRRTRGLLLPHGALKPCGDGIVSGLSLAGHPDSGPFLAASSLLSQDGVQQGGFWEVAGHMAPPFDLSGTLTAGTGLLGPCSLQDLLF